MTPAELKAQGHGVSSSLRIADSALNVYTNRRTTKWRGGSWRNVSALNRRDYSRSSKQDPICSPGRAPDPLTVIGTIYTVDSRIYPADTGNPLRRILLLVFHRVPSISWPPYENTLLMALTSCIISAPYTRCIVADIRVSHRASGLQIQTARQP